MSWLQFLWPEQATLAQRLFRVVAVASAATLVISGLLPTSHNAFPSINLLMLWISVPSRLLLPFLGSHLMRQAAARRAPDSTGRGLLRVGAVVLLMVGIAQVLLLAFFLFLMAVFEFEPRADGDSFFG